MCHGYCVSLLLPKWATGEGSVRQAQVFDGLSKSTWVPRQSLLLSQHYHCYRSTLLMMRSGDGKTGKAEQLQHLCQRWLTQLQQGSQEYRRDVCFENGIEVFVQICLKIQRQVFYISLFKTGERRCSFPTEQEVAVLSHSTIQGLRYYTHNCIHVLIFFFKHSNTFKNEDVRTMKALKVNLRDEHHPA